MAISLTVPKPDPHGTVSSEDVWQLAQAMERLIFLVEHDLHQLQQQIKEIKEGRSLGK